MKAQAIGSEATSGNDCILHWRQRISVCQWRECWGRRIASIPSHRSSVYCALCVLSEWVRLILTSQRTSPGLPTPSLSPRRHNSAYTFSAGWKEQASLHPSSPPSTGVPLRACWPAASLSGTETAVQQTARPSSGQWTPLQKIIGAPLPSILDIFLTRCSSKAKSIVEDPTHPSHSLFQLLPSGRRYRSIRARSARLLNSFFPQAVRALNSHHTAPLWNPKQPPPPPYHISGKTVKLLSLWNSGERACTSHL